MTPTQHKAAAETLLSQAASSPDTATRTTLLRARAHSMLGTSAGSGAHYNAADTLLTGLASASFPTAQRAHRAVVHASLAGTVGTGSHYVAADQILTVLANTEPGFDGKQAEIAHVHALLADR